MARRHRARASRDPRHGRAGRRAAAEKDTPEIHQAENGRKTPALNVREEDFAMPIALTTPQLNQVRTIAAQVPRHLRAQFLSRLAEFLPQEFGDGDLWRAAHRAVQEVLTPR